MNSQALAHSIDDALNSAFPIGKRDISENDRWKMSQAIAKAVVEHIQNYALVTGVCPTGGGPLADGKVL